MEDFETYEQPYNPKEPVVVPGLEAVTLMPTSAQRLRRARGEARYDSEYERHGTANVFCE